MVDGVKARYSKGAIMPLEPLDIEEGASLRINIEVESRAARGGTWPKSVESGRRRLEGHTRPG